MDQEQLWSKLLWRNRESRLGLFPFWYTGNDQMPVAIGRNDCGWVAFFGMN